MPPPTLAPCATTTPITLIPPAHALPCVPILPDTPAPLVSSRHPPSPSSFFSPLLSSFQGTPPSSLSQCTPPHSTSCQPVPPLLQSPSHQPHSFKVTLSDTSKIPLLNASKDWPQWYATIVEMVDNLGLFCHICCEQHDNINTHPTCRPSFSPTLPEEPLAEELEEFNLWQDNGIVCYILCSCLGPV